jgi:acyl-CoA thioester hydrolase
VEVRCTIAEVRRSAFRMSFEMHVEDRLAAEGYGWLVGFDYAAQKAIRLPDDLRDALEAAVAGAPSA